jgi:hypothetical protein
MCNEDDPSTYGLKISIYENQTERCQIVSALCAWWQDNGWKLIIANSVSKILANIWGVQGLSIQS